MRRRIMLLVVGMTTLVVLAFAIPTAILVRAVVEQRADQAAIDQARNTAIYLNSGSATPAQITTYAKTLASNTGRPTWITTCSNLVLGSTPPPGAETGAPGCALPDGGPGGDRDRGGFAPQVQLHRTAGGQLAEAFTADEQQMPYVVRVFLSDDARHSGEATWWLLIGLGSLGLLLIGIAAAELSTRRIVRPLIHTAATAQQLATGDTTARAPTDGPPEVAEVGTALNRLANRIDELIAEERETVADLSHRLRTPLTALRLDAEALRDPAESERISASVGALERMLTAVIRAARRPQREGRMPSCDATAVVGDRVQFWSALADDQDRRSTIVLPPSALPVRAAAEDLAAAVDALLENVIAHTPEGTAFSVTLQPSGGAAELVIADSGPGIPADADVRGRSDRGSSGLGLDIARRVAEGSGGSMTISRGVDGGAVVTLLLNSP